MLALIALGLSAQAFSPDADTLIGVEPTRVHRFHVERQHALRHGAAWQDFLQGEGAGWQARFDERTGLPLSAWGPPVVLGTLRDGPAVDAAVRSFLERNPGLVGVPVDQLAVQSVARDGEAWTLQLVQRLPEAGGLSLQDPMVGGDQALPPERVLDPLGLGGGLVDLTPDFPLTLAASGVPVYGATVQLRIVDGRLVYLANHLVPGLDDAVKQPTLSAATAIEVAVADGPEPLADHQVQGARLVVLPVEAWGLDPAAPAGLTGEGLSGQLVYEVHTRTLDPAGLWVSYVDAASGVLLSVHNEVRYIDGTLTGTHDKRTVDGEYETSPLVELVLSGDAEDGESTYTDDSDGSWSLEDSEEATATLTGRMVSVNNSSGDEAEVDFDGDFTWTTDDATQAEIDTYVFLNQVIDWKDVYAPDVSVGGRMRSNVNISSYCNAYFDGSVNFYQAGGSCNNTGRIADVNYHEWGHGLHYYSLESGSYDGSFGEGAADVVSMLMTGDYEIGPYFYTSGAPVREISTDKVYPDDYGSEVHSNGLIFGGAMWDLWGVLQDDLGDDDTAYDALAGIFTGLLTYGPSVAESYDAAVLADDDNGDLSDGTPHICSLIEAFGTHGLGPAAGAGGVISLSTIPLENQPADVEEYSVSADVLNIAPDCFEFSASDATVHYSVDGGETWAEVAATGDGESVTGAIPGQPAGTIVQYYITAESDGISASVPDGGFINPFTFVVGDLVEIYCEDFEADDGGYTHDLLEGTEQEGADDWIWASPRGYADDPEFAASGDYIWGNDLGGGNYNGEYQPDKHNRLRSVPIDVSGYETVVLQYQRWLAVEDGYWDHAELVRIHGEDDDSTDLLWTNYDSPGGSSSDHSDHHIDMQWAPHSLEIDVSDGEPLQLGWDIISDSGLEFGGWNIDDVCIYAVVDDETPAGDGGASDGGSEDGGSEDGGAVADGGAEADGGATGDGGSTEGGDDTGLSADSGDAADGDDWKVEPAGCGCSAAAPAPTSPLLGLVGLLLGLVGLRRRRR